MVLPFHRRSPPELTIAPVSRFKALPAARVVVWLMSALAAMARAMGRSVRRILIEQSCGMCEQYNRLSLHLAQRLERTVIRSRAATGSRELFSLFTSRLGAEGKNYA